MRLFGITIPDEKQLQYGLTVIYGIGLSKAQEILDTLKIDRFKHGKDVTTEEENAIREEVEKLVLEGDLKREKAQNVKRLKDIESYRGSRHSRNLPTRGQRTKTNNRTVRGNKKVTMGSGRKTDSKK